MRSKLNGSNRYWSYRSALCAGCKDFIIEIALTKDSNPVDRWRQVYPIGANRGPVPVEVPANIAEDYVEACNVLPISPKASAALSRRCLQNMLRANNYKARDLAHEIDLLLNDTDPMKALPRKLRETVDAIRVFGNFAAHPTDNKATLELIEVESHEAEWYRDDRRTIRAFLRRACDREGKKAALDEKLAAGGKPPSR
jgi:hypothetical protein